MTATQRLVTVLEVEEKLLPDGAKKDFARLVISRAKKFYYHDFKGPLATPKMQLVSDLRQIGLEALAQQVIDGDFDDGDM